MMYTCKLSSPIVGTGTRNDPIRPLFRDEYPQCAFGVVGGGSTDGYYILNVGVPNEETRQAIVEDERFPSWDWAVIPEDPLSVQQVI